MRKLLFWTHLTVGCLAGLVILVMSVTGVLLAYEKQIAAWADRGIRSHPAPVRASVDALIQSAGKPAALVFHNDPTAPVEANLGREKTLYLDAYTAQPLGEASQSTRAFFASVKSWHRWLATEGPTRPAGRAITGACNVAFLGLLASGLVLWCPKKWSLPRVKQGLILRWNLKGKPRDWNWHNAIGFWCAIPLLVIVVSGVVMSYPGQQPQRRRESRSQTALTNLDPLLSAAQKQVPGWKSITLQVPPAGARTATFSIDEGNGGRPDLRSQLTVNTATAQVTQWEKFNDNDTNHQLRSWLRFAHTGEAGGWPGQTLAGIASLGAVFLVYTGFALALRRLAKFRAKRVASSQTVSISA